MKKNNTFTRHKISKMMHAMGLQEISGDDKKSAIYANPQGSNIVTVPLQQGRCQAMTLRNALEKMLQRPPTHIIDRLMAGDMQTKTKSPYRQNTQVNYTPLSVPSDLKSKNMTRHFAESIFRESGWEKTNQRGSHTIFKPDKSSPVAIALISHGRCEKTIKVKRLCGSMSIAAGSCTDPGDYQALLTLRNTMVQALQRQ